MIVQKNNPSVAKQIAEANTALPGLDRPSMPNHFPRLKKAGAVAGVAALAAAIGVVGGMDKQDELNHPSTSVSFTEAPHQVTPDQITDETPSTTLVEAGNGDGPYQVVEHAVQTGAVSPEDAAQAQVGVQEYYETTPGGVHPGDSVPVQVSPKR